MKIRLLALDLDGTLLDADSQLPEENRRAVAAALRAGLRVVLVTGRPWRTTRPHYDALGLTDPAICYLGALVVGDREGRILAHRPLAVPAWTALRRLARAGGLSLTACVGARREVAPAPPDGSGGTAQGERAADAAYATCRAPDFRPWEAWNPYTEIAADPELCPDPPTMAAIYGTRAVKAVLAAFPHGLPESQYDLEDRVAEETVLHVWHAAVDKGRALAALCRSLSIPPEAVMAVGDARPDASMLAFAGLGVAVPHADPALRAAADWVCRPAEAVARILKEEGRL